MMLLGEYTYQIAPQHRVAVPKKLRGELGNDLIASRGYEGCIILVPKEQWQELMRDVISQPITNPESRDSARFLLGGAHDVVLDSQGRFIVPQSLWDFAGLQEVAVFVGLGGRVELWDMNRWSTLVKRFTS
jgi:MraZ protein